MPPQSAADSPRSASTNTPAIFAGDASRGSMVPAKVAEVINAKGLFHLDVDAASP